MSPPAVSAICVSYNCAELLRGALASLVAQEVPGGLEVLVVDNASADDSVRVAASFEGVKVSALERNVGFAAANNAGARAAGGDRLLFVNPDVEAPPNVVAALARWLAARPAAAAVGPALAAWDGALQRYAARRFPNVVRLAAQVSGFAETRWGNTAFVAGFYPRAFYTARAAQVDALSGACMMVRRTAFERVGGFDERYFLYGEDVDLCRRLAAAGAEVWYVPVGPVRHFTGGSRRTPSAAVVAASHASAVTYAALWLGPAAAAVIRAVSRASLAGRRVVFGAAGLVAPACRSRARLYRDAAALSRKKKAR